MNELIVQVTSRNLGWIAQDVLSKDEKNWGKNLGFQAKKFSLHRIHKVATWKRSESENAVSYH